MNYGYSLSLIDTVVSGNSANSFGGGVDATGAALILRCTITGNNIIDPRGSGAGVVVSGLLTMVDSTVSGNSASKSGGITAGTFATRISEIVGSTISGNSGTGQGAAIYNVGGTLVIRSSTITANTSTGATPLAAVVSKGNSTTTTKLQSSIVSGNTLDVGYTSTVNTLVSLGYNLVGTGNGTVSFNQPGDQTGVRDPMLGPLADNGGPTKTHALLDGSPAIDAGDPGALAGIGDVPQYDQRGAPFTRVYGGRIDIGALERQPISSTVMGDYNQNGVVDTADYMVWRMNRGTTGVTPYTGADGSGNGIIDEADYSLWRMHYGSTVPAAGSAASVEGGVGSVEGVAAVSASSEEIVRQPPALPGVGIVAGVQADAGGALDVALFGGATFGTAGQVRHGEFRATSSVARLRALAEPVAPEVLRDDALVAWLAVRGDERGVDSADGGDAAIDESTQQVSDDLGALDSAFGELVSSAVR